MEAPYSRQGAHYRRCDMSPLSQLRGAQLPGYLVQYVLEQANKAGLSIGEIDNDGWPSLHRAA